MTMTATSITQIILSGRVSDHQPFAASHGDIRLYPSQNNYVDASVFDGEKWRRLDLAYFGLESTKIHANSEIGPMMRFVAGKARAGVRVTYNKEKRRFFVGGAPFHLGF
jgi:hypothetical protein